MAREWNSVVLAIAYKMGKRVVFDTASRTAMPTSPPPWRPPRRLRVPSLPLDELVRLVPDELVRLVSEDTGHGYRIQFLGAGADEGPTILAEVVPRTVIPGSECARVSKSQRGRERQRSRV